MKGIGDAPLPKYGFTDDRKPGMTERKAVTELGSLIAKRG